MHLQFLVRPNFCMNHNQINKRDNDQMGMQCERIIIITKYHITPHCSNSDMSACESLDLCACTSQTTRAHTYTCQSGTKVQRHIQYILILHITSVPPMHDSWGAHEPVRTQNFIYAFELGDKLNLHRLLVCVRVSHVSNV